jgi:hypothetical protein
MSNSNSYDNKSSSFDTLNRELSVRINPPNKDMSFVPSEKFREMSIQSNQINLSKLSNISESVKPKQSDSVKPKQSDSVKPKQSELIRQSVLPKSTNSVKSSVQIFSDRPQPSESVEPSVERKIKYIETTDRNFMDIYSKGTYPVQNYNTDQENDLRFSVSTRRKTLPKQTLNTYKNISRDTSLDTIGKKSKNQSANDKFITNLISTDSKLRPNTATSNDNIMAINSNLITDIAAKVSKASAEYWDNTKRRNLDTATYTNNPHKIQGRGFGDIDSYDLFMNGVGTSTRQDNPDKKPQNTEDDRIFMTNHNYHYDKFHVTESLPCGSDTRYLNKKML